MNAPLNPKFLLAETDQTSRPTQGLNHKSNRSPLDGLTPIVLCGGQGSRLWPASRGTQPKQFHSFGLGEQSLFQSTLTRLEEIGAGSAYVATTDDLQFLAREQANQAGFSSIDVLVEPEAKNTAAAFINAALAVAEKFGEDRPVLLCPSDHLIASQEGFAEALRDGLAYIDHQETDAMVLFGVIPDQPHTGYGYIQAREDSVEMGAETGAETGVLTVKRFVEKPDRRTAEQYVQAPDYFWNAGLVLARAGTILDAAEEYCPEILAACESKDWSSIQSLSFDYAVLEKASALALIPCDFAWSDLGGWQAIHQALPQDDEGVATIGDATLIDCANSLAVSNGPSVTGFGLEGLLIVAEKDTVLVAPLDDAEAVKQLVAELKANNAAIATESQRTHRPWGWYDLLNTSDRYQVKEIVVKPGGRLSLQSHHHRAEHWIVVSGMALVEIDGEMSKVGENQSIFVPLAATHRLENPGKIPMRLIEVQSGSYLGEDDIVRYDDVYGRVDVYGRANVDGRTDVRG